MTPIVLFLASVTTAVLISHVIVAMAKPSTAPLHRLVTLERRVNEAVRACNTRFAAQHERLSVLEEVEHPEETPSQQSGGPYRTGSADESTSEDPPEIRKPFVGGQTVDVAFLDDAEPKDGPLLRFSAVFERFSKDANGLTQVWLRCVEEKPEPYPLQDVLMCHPGDPR